MFYLLFTCNIAIKFYAFTIFAGNAMDIRCVNYYFTCNIVIFLNTQCASAPCPGHIDSKGAHVLFDFVKRFSLKFFLQQICEFLSK